MKTQKFFYPVLGFLTGIVFSFSMVGLLAFTNGPATPAPTGPIPITSSTAHSYVINYLSDATSVNLVIKGFTIDLAQLEAMNSIAKENPALTGFRIYYGKDSNAKKVGIVVGVDNTGKDAVKNTIFNTDSPVSSPCPPICDTSSPISGN